MSLSAIPKPLRVRIFERDAGRCQYCRLAQIGQAAVFHINHIIPKSKGGLTDESNLVLQCPHCSLHKSDRTEWADPLSGKMTLLFHPRQQQWNEHFVLDNTGLVREMTATGRATIEALSMNNPLPRIAQDIQLRLGLLIPSI